MGIKQKTMFKIFKRRKDKPSVMYGVFQKVGAWCEVKQRVLCERLNHRAALLTVRQLKLGLVIFCIVYIGCIAGIMTQTFNTGSDVIRIQSIHKHVMVVPGSVIDSLRAINDLKKPLKSK